MATPSSSSSSLPRHVLRYVSPRLGALHRSPLSTVLRPKPAAAVGAAAAYYQERAVAGRCRGDKIAAASATGALVLAARRGAPPKGRPGDPRQGGGGQTNAAPTAGQLEAARKGPPPKGQPGDPRPGGGGQTNVAPTAELKALTQPGPSAQVFGAGGGSINTLVELTPDSAREEETK